jgi:hypothetical protein
MILITSHKPLSPRDVKSSAVPKLLRYISRAQLLTSLSESSITDNFFLVTRFFFSPPVFPSLVVEGVLRLCDSDEIEFGVGVVGGGVGGLGAGCVSDQYSSKEM